MLTQINIFKSGEIPELPPGGGSEGPRTPAPSGRAVGGETYFIVRYSERITP